MRITVPLWRESFGDYGVDSTYKRSVMRSVNNSLLLAIGQAIEQLVDLSVI